MQCVGILGGIGMPELLVILGIAVLIFGASRIPQIARSLGKSMGEFKKGKEEGAEPSEEPEEEEPKQDSPEG